jgi:hypothetical protein
MIDQRAYRVALKAYVRWIEDAMSKVKPYALDGESWALEEWSVLYDKRHAAEMELIEAPQ